ncbi:MAG: hypothetical protein DRP45_06310 [Candidatus Zixiibacteriota bacterium]|nr:MAG: hypothetical protein DRP45_06310 [candidate division Zixibacteria bacterium]
MSRRAFLLGFFSIAGQVLLLRELVSSFNGNELFIGVALFGWLGWVALGAFLGGKKNKHIVPGLLFIIGGIILPLCVVATRLSPLVVTDIVGEIVPFSVAAVISVVVMLPVGVLSGWLFPVLARSSQPSAGTVVQVYLFEGIGAFVGGVTVLFLVGTVLSTLGMALVVGVITATSPAILARRLNGPAIAVFIIGALLCLGFVPWVSTRVDTLVDSVKYRSYRVERSFDTHYGHQAMLSADETRILLTDNAIEAVQPDLSAYENMLIPPLVYCPEARSILYFGRIEFGLTQLMDSLGMFSITAVDPRGELNDIVEDVAKNSSLVTRITSDPIAYVSKHGGQRSFDIIIIPADGLDSYQRSRLFTGRFLRSVKSMLTDGGLLFVPTRYDTDRYVTEETRELLSAIHNVIAGNLSNVTFWPGERTLLFASDTQLFDIPYDSIINRLLRLEYSPQYISDNYLADRLDEFSTERLISVMAGTDITNSLERPRLSQIQTWYRSKTSDLDRKIVSSILRQPWWLVGIPVLILVFFFFTLTGEDRSRRAGLFLYFTAGLVSLSLELLSFYVYQSMAGSLFSEIAVLIGAFMLGLALGAYFVSGSVNSNMGCYSLLMLLAATVIFFATYEQVHPHLLLAYYLLFLFSVALGTGSLFVAATNRYYGTQTTGNRGLGYAFELVGSSIGALLTTTVLLPIIGLHWLLASLGLVLCVALLGSLLAERVD